MAIVTLASLENLRSELVKSRYYLNIRSGYMAPVTLHCSYGDSGASVVFYIFDGGDPFDLTGATVSIHGTRRDGANFGPFACTVDGNSVTFTLQTAMTAVEGGAIAEFTISKNGATIGSCNFGIMVENAAFPNGVAYDTDPSVYYDILKYTQEAISVDRIQFSSLVAQEALTRQTEDNSLSDEIAVERARIDNYLNSGTAASDSELIDVRVGSNGVTYASAGDAVRNQINDLYETTGTKNYTLIDKSGNGGTGTANLGSRLFIADPIPAFSRITEVKYFCASSTSGTLSIDIWECESDDVLTKVYTKVVTPVASTVNIADVDYTTTRHALISFTPSAANIRYNSNDTDCITYYSTNLTSTKLNYSLIASTYIAGSVCATVKYASSMDDVLSSMNYRSWSAVNWAENGGTGTSNNTYRFFPAETIPSNTFIDTVKFYAASAATGYVSVELWEKNGYRSSWRRVYVKNVIPTKSSVNVCSIKYLTTSQTMVSLKSTTGTGFRIDSTATDGVIYAYTINNTSYTLDLLEKFVGWKICMTVDGYRLTGQSKNYFVVDKTGSGDYTSFSEALIDVFENHPNSVIAVNPGTYDICDEMMAIQGASFWDNLTTSDDYVQGLPFGNGMHIIGSPGAIIQYDTTGSTGTTNTVAWEYFSPLMGRFGSDGYKLNIVEGLTFNLKRGRYCIHLDEGGIPNDYTFIIRNCKFYVDNSGNTIIPVSDALGMGASINTTYEIDNCYINGIRNTSLARDNESIYYHTAVETADQNNKLIITNTYIDNGGTIRIDMTATGTGSCHVQITNNSIASAIIDEGTSDIARRAIWGNEIRS